MIWLELPGSGKGYSFTTSLEAVNLPEELFEYRTNSGMTIGLFNHYIYEHAGSCLSLFTTRSDSTDWYLFDWGYGPYKTFGPYDTKEIAMAIGELYLREGRQ